MSSYSLDFIKEIPKSDLHLHLDGSLRISSLIDMAKRMNIPLPAYSESGLRKLVFKENYANLEEYLRGFQYTCAVLRDLEHIEQAAYELAIDQQKDGVFYIEVRFAPQLLMDIPRGLTMETVLDAANKGFLRAQKEFNSQEKVVSGEMPEFHYGIICCAMRMFGPRGYSPFYTDFFSMLKYSKNMEVISQAAVQMVKSVVKIRDEQGIPIVGIDLAGQEEGYPPRDFKEAYEYAHKHFMHKTVHAGEAYGAESIFQAITELYADRIGHGYYLFNPNKILDTTIKDKDKYITDLASYIADKRVVIEVCLTSNMQTNPEIKDIKNHNFRHMLDHRMAVTICTDNTLVSNTTVSNEYKIALDNFNIPLKRLKDIVAYGFKKSFHAGLYVEKRSYAKQCMIYFDKIVKKHNIS